MEIQKVPVKICLICDDNYVSNFVTENCHFDDIETSLCQFTSIRDVKDESFDLYFLDIHDATDETISFAQRKVSGAYNRPRLFALCDIIASSVCQNFVLEGLFSDYSVVRPVFEKHYIKVQIRRTLDEIVEQRVIPDSNDSANRNASTKKNSEVGLPLFKRALVLEDNDVSRDLFEEMLNYFGIEVDSSASFIDAFRKYREREYDIFFVDLMMPGISGSDVVKYVKEKFKGDAPIIVTTGHSKKDLVIECSKYGAKGYLLKPLSISLLSSRLTLIHEQLSNKRSMTENSL